MSTEQSHDKPNSVEIIPQLTKPKGKAPPHAWKPGQSGNPLGRPPAGDTYEGCLRRLSALDLDGKGLSTRQAICLQAVRLAKKGVPWAIQFVCERLEGKASVKLEMQSKRSPLADLSDDDLEQAMAWIRQRKLEAESAKILPAQTDNNGQSTPS